MSASLSMAEFSDFFRLPATFARQSLVANFQYPRCDPRQHSGSTLIDRTEVNDPEQKLAEAATHHLTTPDE
jgi:hypothetical protein